MWLASLEKIASRSFFTAENKKICSKANCLTIGCNGRRQGFTNGKEIGLRHQGHAGVKATKPKDSRDGCPRNDHARSKTLVLGLLSHGAFNGLQIDSER